MKPKMPLHEIYNFLCNYQRLREFPSNVPAKFVYVSPSKLETPVHQKIITINKAKMPTCCSVFKCLNRDVKGPKGREISFHTFPKDPDRRELWTEAAGRPNFVPNDRSAICSEHFSEVDFETEGKRKVIV